ncbi:MAG: hypothetical protein JRI23_15255 [Deltaproteobacteria bacterium]|nr:hypothetical protein [Deltaproteobacteria bacterium]MBW2533106.1 hypothetical protein [Deltaproteobacteria bacterium]
MLASRAIGVLGLLGMAVVTSGLLVAACGSADEDLFGGGTAASGATASGTGVGGDAGTGGTATGVGGQGQGGSATCGAEAYPAEPKRLDLIFLVDRSASMQELAKWATTTAALDAFIAGDGTDGLGVALQFFPVEPASPLPNPWACSDTTNASDCGPGGIYGPCMAGICLSSPSLNCCAGGLSPNSSCIVSDYQAVALGVGVLAPEPPAGVRTALLDVLGAESPDGEITPTLQALEGTAAYATGWAAAHADSVVDIVLVTDGEPTGCAGPDSNNPVNSIPAAAAAALSAAQADPSVRTFVIGVGGALGTLDPIAQSGGTGQAYVVNMTGSAGQQIQGALREIVAEDRCHYVLPTPQAGTPDYTATAVALHTAGDNANPHWVARVGSRDECSPTGGGWYYDDPADPTTLILCPATCTQAISPAWDVRIQVPCS